MHKVVRALSFDVERAQGAVGEVPKVVCDDYLSAAADGSGDDVAIVWVEGSSTALMSGS